MISFDNFKNDFLQNAELCTHTSDELHSEYASRMPISDEFRDSCMSIFSCSNNGPVFLYKGDWFSLSDGEMLAYGKSDIFSNILADYGVDELIDEYEAQVKDALIAYQEVDKRLSKGGLMVGLKLDYDDLIYQLCLNGWNLIWSAFKRSVSHTIHCNIRWADSYRWIGLRTFSFSADVDKRDWSFEYFNQHFNLKNIYRCLHNIFNSNEINTEYFEYHARIIAEDYLNVKRLKKGVKISSDVDFYCDNYLKANKGINLINGLKAVFEYSRNKEIYLSIVNLVESKLSLSSYKELRGVRLNVYQKKIAFTFSHDVFKEIAIFVNKFAKDKLGNYDKVA